MNDDILVLASQAKEEAEKYDFSSPAHKELKKLEMYFRKSYIMAKHLRKLSEDDHSVETFLRDLNAALIKDQRFVKMRDGLEEYEI